MGELQNVSISEEVRLKDTSLKSGDRNPIWLNGILRMPLRINMKRMAGGNSMWPGSIPQVTYWDLMQFYAVPSLGIAITYVFLTISENLRGCGASSSLHSCTKHVVKKRITAEDRKNYIENQMHGSWQVLHRWNWKNSCYVHPQTDNGHDTTYDLVLPG